jgi:hypothetical protein
MTFKSKIYFKIISLFLEQEKEQAKLQKEEEKVMKMAAKLSEKQAEQQRIEAQKAAEAMAKDAEARRLANELLNKREQDRTFAEKKMHELQAYEEQVRLKLIENYNLFPKIHFYTKSL